VFEGRDGVLRMGGARPPVPHHARLVLARK
jgi:hypothetical protein